MSIKADWVRGPVVLIDGRCVNATQVSYVFPRDNGGAIVYMAGGHRFDTEQTFSNVARVISAALQPKPDGE